MLNNHLDQIYAPIRFGTDGWRGILGVDITLERLLKVALAAAQELRSSAPEKLDSRKIIIGYDQRFLAPEMAEAIASTLKESSFEPVFAATAVPTPSCSWAVVRHKALGALVVTASHNPPQWLGIKIKGPWGGSVEGEFTKAVEMRISADTLTIPESSEISNKVDIKQEHIDGLRKKFDLTSITQGLEEMGLKVIVDPMHGSAAGFIPELLGYSNANLFEEIRSNRDPLFGGNPPEPLPKYLDQLIEKVRNCAMKGEKCLGLVFDGDGDRIAAVDEKGLFCSTQLLMPLLIEHLIADKNMPGCVIKTVSGSDLMGLVARDLGRDTLEMPVGFKYIASQMMSREVLIGGEESGGVGCGDHLPERDALYIALLLLEALTEKRQGLRERLDVIKDRYGESFYKRVDIRLPNLSARKRLEEFLKVDTPKSILNKKVQEVITIDGVKLRLDFKDWVMFRFSGTEPLLRIYCEAPTKNEVSNQLDWAISLVEKI